MNVSGACGVAFVMTSCGKADLKLAVASKQRPVVHVCESKSNSRLHQPRRGRTNPVAHSAVAWKFLEVKWEHFYRQRHSYHPVLGLLRHFPMAHSRPGTPVLGTAGLMIPAFRNSTLPDICRRNPVGLVGTG